MPNFAFESDREVETVDPMAAFVALVLRDETRQARLCAIENPDAYVAATLAIAAAHRIALDEDAIRATLRPDPAGVARFFSSPVTLDCWPSRGWLPTRSVPAGGVPAMDWAWFGDDRLDDPFYEDTVRRFESRPFNRMFRTRTTFAALVHGIAAADGPEPAGFIYHMSRCGSTLVAQMLAADPSHVVLSEAEPLDGVVRWAMESAVPISEKVAALRAIVAALGRDRSGVTRRLFLKLESWHAAALPLFRAAFPATPWVFLFRAPVEVLVSQMRERGIHTVPGLVPPNVLAIPNGEGMAPEHYAALSLVRVIEAIQEHRSLGGGLLIDYDEMPAAIADRIAPHFGFAPDERQRVAMAAVSGRHAKAPARPFVSDTATKRHAATPAILAAARQIIDPAYENLKTGTA